MDLKKIFRQSAVAVVVLTCLAASLFIIFTTGMVVFTLAGFGIVFGLGMVAGIFISARLFIACTKTDD